MDKVQPFVKCLRPIYIRNKRTGEPLITNCGKCKACIMHHQAMQSLKCKLESEAHQYTMFITLTYDNVHVPRLSGYPERDDEGNEYIAIRNITDRIPINDVYRCDTTWSDFKMLQAKTNLHGDIPYLNSYDLKCFIKRLRKNLSKYEKNNFSFRYYATGEYGPVHFRPHYHLLLWFEDQRLLEVLGENIHKAWTYGRIDYSLSQGKSTSYVAGYLNSYCNLPQVLKLQPYRPFASHSQKLGEKILTSSKEEVYEDEPLRVVNRSVKIAGSCANVHMWKSLQARYLPLCKDFSTKSHDQRMYSYLIYDVVRRWTGETSAYKQAKALADSIMTYGTDIEYYYSIFGPEVGRFIEYITKSLRIDVEPLDVLQPDDIRACPYIVDGKRYTYMSMLKYLFNSLYYELRISYNFLNHCCDNTYTITRVLHVIEIFYATLELDALNNMYQQMSDYVELEQLTPNETMYMYNNVASWFVSEYDYVEHIYYIRSKLLASPLFRKYCSDIEDKYNKSIKHKLLNDKNLIFNNI